MIPIRYVEELKNARVDEVDFVGTFFEVSRFDLFEDCCRKTHDWRCSRAGTRHLVVGRVCTLEWRKSN